MHRNGSKVSDNYQRLDRRRYARHWKPILVDQNVLELLIQSNDREVKTLTTLEIRPRFRLTNKFLGSLKKIIFTKSSQVASIPSRSSAAVENWKVIFNDFRSFEEGRTTAGRSASKLVRYYWYIDKLLSDKRIFIEPESSETKCRTFNAEIVKATASIRY